LLICGSGPAPASRVFVNAAGELEQRAWRVSSQAHNPTLLASALIAHLDMESCVIHQLDIPSLLMDEQALTLAEACVRRFQAAQTATTKSVHTTLSHAAVSLHLAPCSRSISSLLAISLFYLPRFDEWWSQTSIPSLHPLRAALITCLRNLMACASSTHASASTCNIFLATTTCNRTSLMQMDIHPFLLDFFRSNCTVSFHKPNPVSLQAFYTAMVQDASLSLAKYLARFVHAPVSAPQDPAPSSSSVPFGESGVSDIPPPESTALAFADAPDDTTIAVESATVQPSPSTDDALLAPVPPPPPPSISTLAVAVDAAFAAFSASSTPSPLTALVRSLQLASAQLDFIDLQRVQFDVERWMHEQMERFRQNQKHRRMTDSRPEDDTLQAFFSTLQQQYEAGHSTSASGESRQWDLPWTSLLQFITSACQQRIEYTTASRTAATSQPSAAAAPNEWMQMASKHAQATSAGRSQAHDRL
jgi:hypothetical protein